MSGPAFPWLDTPEWWRKPPSEMTREELIARAETLLSVNGILKREIKVLSGENAELHVALIGVRQKLAAISDPYLAPASVAPPAECPACRDSNGACPVDASSLDPNSPVGRMGTSSAPCGRPAAFSVAEGA